MAILDVYDEFPDYIHPRHHPGKQKYNIHPSKNPFLYTTLRAAAVTDSKVAYAIDSDEFMVVRNELFQKADFDCLAVKTKFNAKDKSLFDLLSVLQESTYSVRFNQTETHSPNLIGKVFGRADDLLAVLWINVFDSKAPFFEKIDLRGNVASYGHPDVVTAIDQAIKDGIGELNTPMINWHYIADGQSSCAEIELKNDQTVHDAYYPFIKGGIESYFDRFLASSESIIILLGPPGTGKSSFLRYLLSSRNLSSTITYEEELLKKDRLFISHLIPGWSNSDVLILEDADILLMSRESSSNAVMNKLLNVSDGIIKIMSKKIIFTTNLPSVKDVDEAILRPGRCFDVLEFRELTYKEACAAAEAAGVPIPEKNKSYTLAEIFQQKTAHSVGHKLGF